MRQISLDFDAERIEQGGRPAGLQGQPLAVATERKNAQRKERPAGDQQGDAKNPEGANRQVGFGQLSCPR
jgi:hypothetical protein